MRNNFLERLEFLQKEALDEGIVIDSKSEFAMFSFLEKYNVEKYPLLFLTDPGQFGTTWRDDSTRITIRFFDNNLVRYSIIRKIPDNSEGFSFDCVASEADFEEVLRIINNYNLNFLLWDKNEQ